MSETYTIPVIQDTRGDLLPVEFSDLSFEPQRVFVVKNVPVDEERGGHAHYETIQLLICLKGKIFVSLDSGTDTTEKTINEGESILVEKMVWDKQKFLTGQDILLVICSTPFNENDYIRDYKKFLEVSIGE